MSETSEHYRVERSADACSACGHGAMWTIVEGDGDAACMIGTSWGDEEIATDICELMNMAYDAAREAAERKR